MSLCLSTVLCMADEQGNSQAFWDEFRKSASNYDYDQLVGLTKFPFVLHGEADFIPARKINKKQFVKIIKDVLEQQQVIIKNGDMASTTTREIVVGTKSLTESNILLIGNSFRVSDLVFEKIDNHWKLVRGYLVEE